MLDNISTPSKTLFVFTFFAQLVGSLYDAWALKPPPLFPLLSSLASASILWWWLKEDSRKTGDTWPMDLGYFLYLAWLVIIPYHLFATRGLKGFIGIVSYIGVFLAGWLVAVLIILLIQSQP